MTPTALLPPADYRRIYEIIYSVLEASQIAMTGRSCLFFASVGTLILREHYKLPATISAGCMALMVDEANANVVVYGREEDGRFIGDDDAFHAWIQCDGWLIDFMAPIMGDSLRADGGQWDVPRRMLQKPLQERMEDPRAIQHVGEFYAHHDAALAERLLDRQGVQFGDLMRVCQAWFRRPPEPPRDIMLGDTHGQPRKLVLRAPAIEGAW